MEPIRVLNSQEEVVSALRSISYPAQSEFKAFYNSRLNAVVTDPTFMVVPIDDHMVHRGHSVFDTLLVVEGQTFLLQQHIARIVKSAQAARIDLPKTPEELAALLKDLVAVTKLRTCKLRYWISAGPGNLTVLPVKGMSTFYALVYTCPDPRQDIESRTGYSEFTVDIPLKPQKLATMKSTNYLLNAQTAMSSEEQGGHFGIQKDENGYITECAVANISFILPDNRFVTPPFESILTGTVLSRLLVHAKTLQERGVLTSVEQRPIHITEAKTAVELIQSGGDGLTPIIRWDGVQIGSGASGPIFQQLRDLFLEEMYGNDPAIKEAVPYARYE